MISIFLHAYFRIFFIIRFQHLVEKMCGGVFSVLERVIIRDTFISF